MSERRLELLTVEAQKTLAGLTGVSSATQAALIPMELADQFNLFRKRLLALQPELATSMPQAIPLRGTGADRKPVINHIELRVFWKQALRAIPAKQVLKFHTDNADRQLTETQFVEQFL